MLLKEVKKMKLDQIKKKAKKLGIKPSRMRKADLIRAIQKTEGNFECFETAEGCCDQIKCCWRNGCVRP